jgi:hypothetical protein
MDIKSRVIGTGFIGGKAAGMLLARKILSEDKILNWSGMEEPQDSFYIGSDIFYSFIVQNQLWKLRMTQKTPEGYIGMAKILRDKMVHGTFSQDIMESFQQVVEYFGASPIIVRSSSLLEDGFGNAFAGKYESVFLANQGTPEKRYIQFADAVKKVYASTMGEDVLIYRKSRGLDQLDEQMALLVQRVSGSQRKDVFFPDVSGVGLSYNTYVWNDKIDPSSGMLRLVCGLGTRAVNRVAGDYPAMAALSQPLVRPYSEKGDEIKFSQHNIDLIDTKANDLKTIAFSDIIESGLYNNLNRVAERNIDLEESYTRISGRIKQHWIINFKKLLSDSKFTETFRGMMQALEKGYDYPVEIEFTLNFAEKDDFKINLLQCRPLQRYGNTKKVNVPEDVNPKNMLFSSQGYFIGGNISQKINKIIYVEPKSYIGLRQSDKYGIARSIGKINSTIKDRYRNAALLIGPGRWGTSTPSLGVPVSFSEISNIRVMVEVAFPEGNLMPELSFGTHFFQDLVETDIFYAALFTHKKSVIFNPEWFDGFQDVFADSISGTEKYGDCIKVYDTTDTDVKIISDIVSQKMLCFKVSV